MFYIFAAATLMLAGFALLYFVLSSPLSSNAKIKITICADDGDEAEKAILNLYHHCELYFKNYEIKVTGPNHKYIDILTRAYRFLKKDD